MNLDLTILKDVSLIPNLDDVYKTCQSLAAIEAILMQEWEYRYFSFNDSWDTNQSMASMRDGSGSHYYMLFDLQLKSCIGKLYVKSLNAMNLSDVKELVAFKDFMQEPAFENDIATIYFYKISDNSTWQSIPSLNDIPFLGFLTNKEKAYIPWAESYYEVEINTLPVIQIFNYQPITTTIINQLNHDCCISTLKDDLNEIGYPFQDLM